MSANEKTFSNLVGFYSALLKAADKSTPITIYTGHITKLATELGIAGTKYTTCIFFLREMGCITQLRRGAKSAPSVWQLNFAPTVERYNEIDPESRLTMKELADRIKVLEQGFRTLNNQLGGLNLQTELANLARQLKKAEQRKP